MARIGVAVSFLLELGLHLVTCDILAMVYPRQLYLSWYQYPKNSKTENNFQGNY